LRTSLGGRASDSTEQPVRSGSGFSRAYDKQAMAAPTTIDCSWAPDFTEDASDTVVRRLAALGIEFVDVAAPET
jgi:hypothetical protein